MNKPSFFSPENPIYPLVIAANVIVTTFLAVFSAVTTMIADSSIQGELALSDTEAIWLTTLYLLGVNIMVPTSNWFAYQFGPKRVYTYGVLLFTVASLFAACSQNFWTIATARMCEGIGAGFIFPIGLGLLVRSLPKTKIQLGVNLYVALGFGGGMSLGVILAGYFSQFLSWRESFFTIVPLGILAAGSCWLSRRAIAENEPQPFDLFGFLTFALFISSFLIALTLGPIRATDQGWRTPYILGCFVIAFFSFLIFLWIELRHPNPLFPIVLFKDPIFTVSLVAMFLLGMAIFTGMTTSIHYMLTGLLYEKFITGKIIAIYGVTIGVVGVIANYLAKVIPIPILTFAGLSLLIFSYFYNNELSWLTGYHEVVTLLLIRGAGIGLSLGATTILALQGIPEALRPAGATIVTFFRQIGGTYGTTLLAIFSIRQTIFHAARFGEQANSQLPAYKMTMQNLYNKYPDAARAKAAIIRNIEVQASIQGMNDALVAFGYVTVIVTFALLALLLFRIWKSKKSADHVS